MGQSAIEQINPIYFQGAAVHPRDRGAAVPESIAGPRAPQFADHYGWEQGQEARNADCVDCPALQARDSHAGEVVFAVAETGWTAEPPRVQVERQAPPVAEPDAKPAAEEEPAGFIVEYAEVDRYAYYPVEEEQAEPVEAAAQE
jgi:hypothetical protein